MTRIRAGRKGSELGAGRPGREHTRRRILFLLLVGAAPTLAACGRKGGLRLPTPEEEEREE